MLMNEFEVKVHGSRDDDATSSPYAPSSSLASAGVIGPTHQVGQGQVSHSADLPIINKEVRLG